MLQERARLDPTPGNPPAGKHLISAPGCTDKVALGDRGGGSGTQRQSARQGRAPRPARPRRGRPTATGPRWRAGPGGPRGPRTPRPGAAGPQPRPVPRLRSPLHHLCAGSCGLTCKPRARPAAAAPAAGRGGARPRHVRPLSGPPGSISQGSRSASLDRGPGAWLPPAPPPPRAPPAPQPRRPGAGGAESLGPHAAAGPRAVLSDLRRPPA